MTPSISTKDLLVLEDIWLRDWHADRGLKGNSLRWWDSLLTFLARRGDQLMPATLIERERNIIERGLASAYFSELLNVVNPDTSKELVEQAVMLLLATPAQRLQAIEAVEEGGEA